MIEVARIYRLDNNGAALKAFADVAINGLLVKGLRIITGKSDNLFVSMPKAQGKDGKWYETVKLLDSEAKEQLQKVVLDAYNA